jgi:molybdopterin-guanine dinucleotide biosynthesis protein A
VALGAGRSGGPGVADAGGLRFDAVVLAGGRARRLGGVSKPDVVVGGRRLLAHVLDAVGASGPSGAASRTVVVGPPGLDVPAGVVRTLEDPPDGGPVAGLSAGLAALRRGDPEPSDLPSDVPSDVPGSGAPERDPRLGVGRRALGAEPWVLVLACDVPRAARAVPDLVAACATLAPDDAVAGAVLIDPGGRDQPLVALYRRAALDEALTVLAATRGPDGVHGASLRALLAPLTLVRVPDDARASADVDTWDDVRDLDVGTR